MQVQGAPKPPSGLIVHWRTHKTHRVKLLFLQLNTEKEMHKSESSRDPNTELPVVIFSWSYECCKCLPAIMCDNTQSLGRSSPKPWCPEFHWGSITYCSLADLKSLAPPGSWANILIASSSSGGWTWYCVDPIINHLVRLSSGQILQANEDVLSCGGFQGPRDHLPLAEGKSQNCLWVRSIHHYTEGQDFSFILLSETPV